MWTQDGTYTVALTDNSGPDRYPTWSSDGQQIAFVAYDGNDSEIYRMTSDGTGRRRVTDNSGGDTEPRWSPDGRKIAFRGRKGTDFEIYKISPNGSNRVRVTDSAEDISTLDWRVRPKN